VTSNRSTGVNHSRNPQRQHNGGKGENFIRVRIYSTDISSAFDNLASGNAYLLLAGVLPYGERAQFGQCGPWFNDMTAAGEDPIAVIRWPVEFVDREWPRSGKLNAR
jgi:hypothetical protein